MDKLEAAYKFIEFVSRESNPSTFSCRNRKSHDILGRVEWYSQWKQFTFDPAMGAIFSHDCLADIQDFLKKQNAKGKS